MPTRVDVSESAAREIDEASLWYLERSAGVAESFAAEIERGIALIAETPQAWPEYEPGFRSYVLRRFPYTVLFSLDHDYVVVEALAHHSRKPGYWRTR